jgi:protein-disulfide isomerase
MWVDYQCPPCADFHLSVLPRLIDNYVAPGKVAIVSHNFPVIDMARGGHESVDAANAALCAADQGKFWSYQDWLFANQGQEAGGSYAIDRLLEMGSRAGLDMSKFQPCVSGGTHDAEVNSEQEISGVAVTYAPSIFVNGKLVPAYDYTTVSAAIDAAIASK